ncbi:ArgS-related anticodon-binding protein NrtL [Streptomyces sp. NPDC001904]|uniref:ArgS-related anticodon-binding protein NrtL n=1 Tax=Streptomyces sp. NPDC001904 TaxID=3154531 RepID=UPI003331832A
MTPADLSRTVLRAVRRAVDDGEFGVVADRAVDEAVARVVVERPRPGGHGDYATNAALQIAKPTGRPPRQIAEVLSRRLSGSPGIAAVDITGPGFLNLTLAAAEPGRELVADILRQGSDYGHGIALRGVRLDLSVPRELRAEVVADALTRTARSQGAEVHRGDATSLSGLEAVAVRPVPVPDPDELFRRLGPDAARWALLHPAAHDHPRTATAEDRAALLAQRETNPLFRVRYAHARTRGLTRNAADLGFDSAPGSTPGHDELVGALAEYPRILLSAARQHAPDRIARHLVVVADTLLPALGDVLPLGGEKPSAAHRARLALAEAAGTVLAGGLTLLGIDAPAHV